MLARLLVAPWWAKGLLSGAAAAAYSMVLTALTLRLPPAGTRRPWADVVSIGLLSALLLGLLTGLLMAASTRAAGVSSQLRALPAARRTSAWRAAFGGGRVPADPQLRATALSLIRSSLTQAQQWQPAVCTCTAAVFIADMVLIFTGSDNAVTALVIMPLVFLGVVLGTRPRQLARRAAALRA